MPGEDDQTQVQELKSLLSGDDVRQAYLIVISGAEIGRMHRIAPGQTLIGRSRSADLVLEEDGISRIHAALDYDDTGAVRANDRGSTNGTLLNGKALTKVPIELRDGDKLQLGGAVIVKFSYQDHLEESFQQRLYSSAVRDPLTGVYNKRYLIERLEQEFGYALRHATPLCLLVLDLDHFGLVNKTWGHAAGDAVLKSVAQRIEANIRLGEIFARYGGEEFVIIMRETDLQHGIRGAERMRVLICGDPVVFNGQAIHVSASMGLSSTEIQDFASAHQLFVDADRRLFEAKRAGRNRVVAPSIE